MSSAVAHHFNGNFAEKMDSPNIEKMFAAKYIELRDELIGEIEELGINGSLTTEIRSYYRKFLDHSVDGGKMTRGVTVVKAMLAAGIGRKSAAPNVLEGIYDDRELLEQAVVLGWCVEWLQAFFLVADDVMDHSHTRRGVPCWYRLEGVTASNAINDSLFLNCCIYRIMKRHLGERKDYSLLLDSMHDMTYNTVIGQHLDTNAQPIDKAEMDIMRVSPERYKAIIRFKTAYYSFYLPCMLGMTLGGITDATLYLKTKNICLAIGEYFQIQDDVLDCYMDPKLLGKVGTDIEEKKCSWLLVQVVMVATPEEVHQLKEHYGVDDPVKVNWVKELYKKYDLQEKFREYEEKSVAAINKMISEVDHEGLRSLFSFLLGRIYKRQK